MVGVLLAGSMAFLVGVVGLPWLIGVLRANGIGQPIHEAVTQHVSKAGTPTMGGVALMALVPLGYVIGLMVVDGSASSGALVLVGGCLAGGAVGAIDDFLKVRRGRNTLGLRERQKSVLLLFVAALVIATETGGADACLAPSLARCGPLPDIGAAPWALWVVVVVWLTANSVNFTDGADGLLAGCSVAPLTLLTAIVFWQYRHPGVYERDDVLQLAIILAAITGGVLALLWWNAAPAKVFIGETGSLAIGAVIAIAALQLHVELLIPVFGAVYVGEGLSSLAQRLWFKITRRLRRDRQPQRLLRMAPIHHHFEVSGWPETHVVFRFWILSAAGSALAGAIFYADAVRHL